MLMSQIEDLSLATEAYQKRKHLSLDSLVINPKLARRLPSAMALRYHALPVAEDNRRITIAMADPDDRPALEAITAALGTRPYVVQSDCTKIDSLLAEVWSEDTGQPLSLLVYHQASPMPGQIQDFAQHLSDLLGSRLSHFQVASEEDASVDNLAEEASGYNLVVFGEPDQPLIQRLLSGSSDLKAAEQMPCSVLIARQPRWPLRHILLIIRGQEMDAAAVDWTIRLARPSNADVTLLAVVPPMPAACSQTAHARYGLAQWLASDTILGHQMRRTAQQLANWETTGMLRFRQGPTESQIQLEVTEGNYDLIIIAAEPPDYWTRRLSGELVTPLLRHTDRPILVAKP
jgi:nucleotide-binding universal stress UspA family protein